VNNQDIDEASWKYLIGTSSEQDAQSRILVRMGAKAIYSLLGAGLRVAQDFKPPILRGDENFDFKIVISAWIRDIGEPILKSIHTIVKLIGQPADDSLCRVLWEQDEKLQLLAALILLQERQPTKRTAKLTLDAFQKIVSNDSSNRNLRQSCILLTLSQVLAQAGYPDHQQSLQKLASEYHMNVDQTLEATSNAGLIYLTR
jgi:hypothetical protein